MSAAGPLSTSAVGSGLSRTDANFKDALLAEIKKSKAVFYNMVVAQAQKIEVAGDRVTFTFSPTQRALCDNLDQRKAWLEGLAQRLSGRRIAVARVLEEAAPLPSQAARQTGTSGNVSAASGVAAAVNDVNDVNALKGVNDVNAADSAKKSTLREQALADAGVQALLEVFPAEIRDVEEM